MSSVIFHPPVRGDFMSEVALENVGDYMTVHKFGSAPDCDAAIPTDVWDGADGLTSTDIWVQPTQARIHALVSASVDDTAAGTGLRTLEVFGLQTWDSIETSEIVILNGTTAVNTAKSYVIIHRMLGRTFGSGFENAGIITATAATDNTITAMVALGANQTRMALYGIGSNKRFLTTKLGTNAVSTAAAAIQGCLLVKERADQPDATFLTKKIWTFRRDDRYDSYQISPIVAIGPAIIKLQVISDTNNVPCNGSIEGLVVSKQQ